MSFGTPVSSCTNWPTSPVNNSGTLYTQFTCSLYNGPSTYTIDLTSVMTQNGAIIYDNVVGPGYAVIINGDPLAISSNDANDAALYNVSLWQTVLYWEPNQDAGTASSSLTVYWPSAFPADFGSTVQDFNEALYAGSIPDSSLFVEATGWETVYTPGGPGTSREYDIYVPEGGAALMYLLLAGVFCGGAGFLASNRGFHQPKSA